MIFIRVLVLLCFCFATSAAPAQEPAVPQLSSFRGKVVYLDFWASWCAPCRQSFPWMNELQKRYADHGFTVIAVNVDHERVDAEKFLRKLSPAFQIRFDPDGDWARRFNVHGMPTSVVLDRNGKARFTHIGFRNADAARYEQQIQQLLAEH
jgi:cytochrome c biogenesis protein CcmG/thiol:disulfide interchange protein DsbE